MDKFPRIQGGLALIYGVLFAAAAGYFGYTVRDTQARADAQVAEAKAAGEKALAEVQSLGKAVQDWSKSVEERLPKPAAPAAQPGK
jgi:hypothetical protein